MRSLFRAFEREGLEFQLIGGQAAILHGAAWFTQDLDLWVRPAMANISAVIRALALCRARIHKLTPPLSLKWFRRGHRFHFVVPERGGSSAYLDLMGRPPRVGSFEAARRREVVFDTAWGRLPAVSIEDLVELKKTDRLSDYEVISRLALLRLAQTPTLHRRVLRWALSNLFNLQDPIQVFASVRGTSINDVLKTEPYVFGHLHRILAGGREPPPPVLNAVSRVLSARIHVCQTRGRSYWRPRIAELRRLRRTQGLLPEGLPVRSLLDASCGSPHQE